MAWRDGAEKKDKGPSSAVICAEHSDVERKSNQSLINRNWDPNGHLNYICAAGTIPLLRELRVIPITEVDICNIEL